MVGFGACVISFANNHWLLWVASIIIACGGCAVGIQFGKELKEDEILKR